MDSYISPNSEFPSFAGPVVYNITTSDSLLDVDLYESGNLSVPLASRRIRVVDGKALFDVGPILRRRMALQPVGGVTGLFADDGCMAEIHIYAGGEFSPWVRCVAMPHERRLRMVTSMPPRRTIRYGESDRILLFVPGRVTVEVEALSPAGDQAQSYEWDSGGGAVVLRLRTTDFDPETERFIVRINGEVAVTYEVDFPVREAVRLAWRTASGSVEHYTFPVVASRTLVPASTAVEDSQGRRTVAAEETTETVVLSRFEPAALTAAIAGAVSSPQVWTVDDERGIYNPVEVVDARTEYYGFGELRNIRLTLRPVKNTRLS
ncbi:MAG: hypothetical protein K2J51_08535 [Alistipes sp.]|nr:hypothetical protein [Alistipes sp.]MDE6858190.1 hypothetical protein [Alistipes sp.]